MDKTTFYKTLTEDYNSGEFNNADKGYDHLLLLISKLGNCTANGHLSLKLEEEDNSGIGLDEIVEDFIDKELGDDCFLSDNTEQIDAMKKLMEAYNEIKERVGWVRDDFGIEPHLASMHEAIKTLSEPMKDSLEGLSI